MAQFDVFEKTNEETKQSVPNLLEVRADLLDSLSTRVVVPPVAASTMGKGVAHLHPEFYDARYQGVDVHIGIGRCSGAIFGEEGRHPGRTASRAYCRA